MFNYQHIGTRKDHKYKVHYNYNKYHSDDIYCIDKKEVLLACKKLLKRTGIDVPEKNILVIDVNEFVYVLESVQKGKLRWRIDFPKVTLYKNFLEEMAKEL